MNFKGKENACEKISSNSAFSQCACGISWFKIVGEKCWTNSSKAELHRSGEGFTAGDDVIDGTGQFKEEFVTSDGVKLNDVDFKTMQSRVVANLLFAGEVLNIDNMTGVFSIRRGQRGAGG